MSADIDVGPCSILFDVVASPAECQPALVHRHGKSYAAAPAFYTQLARWYVRHGEIRAHYPIFAAVLTAADSNADRATGVGLLHHFTLEEVTEVLAVLQTYFGRVPRRFRTAVVQWLHAQSATGGGHCVNRRQRRMLHWLMSQLHLSAAHKRAWNLVNQTRSQGEQIIPQPLSAAWLRRCSPAWVLQNLTELCDAGAFRATRLRPILMEKWWQAMAPSSSDDPAATQMITGRIGVLACDEHDWVGEVIAALERRVVAGRVMVLCPGLPAANLDALRQQKVQVDHLVVLDTRRDALQALQPAYRVYRDTMRCLPNVLFIRQRLAVPLVLPQVQLMPWRVRPWSGHNPQFALAPLVRAPWPQIARDLAATPTRLVH